VERSKQRVRIGGSLSVGFGRVIKPYSVVARFPILALASPASLARLGAVVYSTSFLGDMSGSMTALATIVALVFGVWQVLSARGA